MEGLHRQPAANQARMECIQVFEAQCARRCDRRIYDPEGRGHSCCDRGSEVSLPAFPQPSKIASRMTIALSPGALKLRVGDVLSVRLAVTRSFRYTIYGFNSENGHAVCNFNSSADGCRTDNGDSASIRLVGATGPISSGTASCIGTVWPMCDRRLLSSSQVGQQGHNTVRQSVRPSRHPRRGDDQHWRQAGPNN